MFLFVIQVITSATQILQRDWYSIPVTTLALVWRSIRHDQLFSGETGSGTACGSPGTTGTSVLIDITQNGDPSLMRNNRNTRSASMVIPVNRPIPATAKPMMKGRAFSMISWNGRSLITVYQPFTV